jgi:hypothetical protein
MAAGHGGQILLDGQQRSSTASTWSRWGRRYVI